MSGEGKKYFPFFFFSSITSAKHSDYPPSKQLANFLLVSIDFSRGFGRNHLSAPWGGEGSFWGNPQTSGGHGGHLYACAIQPVDGQQLSREITFQLLIILLHVGGKKTLQWTRISNKNFIWSGFVSGVIPDWEGETQIYTSWII